MLTLAVASLLALCALFALCYFIARRLDNYGIVDIAWAYAFTPTVAFYAFAASDAWLPRRIALTMIVALWSLRLGTHLLRRVAKHHPTEDHRYQQLRRDWAGIFAPKMFGFFQLQAASIVLLALPLLLAAHNPATAFSPLELAAFALWLIAWIGESIADAQLRRFVQNPAHRGQVCNLGLWRYSRHPNYFCEWLIWIAFSVLGCASPFGCFGLLSILIMYFLLTRVTGIPLAEAQSLRSKPEAYRRYQQTTSAFFPAPPKQLPD